MLSLRDSVIISISINRNSFNGYCNENNADMKLISASTSKLLLADSITNLMSLASQVVVGEVSQTTFITTLSSS